MKETPEEYWRKLDQSVVEVVESAIAKDPSIGKAYGCALQTVVLGHQAAVMAGKVPEFVELVSNFVNELADTEGGR